MLRDTEVTERAYCKLQILTLHFVSFWGAAGFETFPSFLNNARRTALDSAARFWQREGSEESHTVSAMLHHRYGMMTCRGRFRTYAFVSYLHLIHVCRVMLACAPLNPAVSHSESADTNPCFRIRSVSNTSHA